MHLNHLSYLKHVVRPISASFLQTVANGDEGVIWCG